MPQLLKVAEHSQLQQSCRAQLRVTFDLALMRTPRLGCIEIYTKALSILSHKIHTASHLTIRRQKYNHKATQEERNLKGTTIKQHKKSVTFT